MEGSIGHTFSPGMVMVLLHFSFGISLIISQQNFHVVTDPNMNISPLQDINWRPQSMVSCAVRCVSLSPRCSSFLYDAHDRQCRPGNGTIATPNWRDVSRELLFVASSRDVGRNNQLDCKNNPVEYKSNELDCRNKQPECRDIELECNEIWGFVFLVSNVYLNYSDSQKVCKAQGLKLVSLKTKEKVRAFQEMAKGYRNNNFWIGLDDLNVEGRFCWLDDGRKIEEEIREVMFNGGEPNDHFGKEDCVGFIGQVSPFNDLECTLGRPFVCEATTDKN